MVSRNTVYNNINHCIQQHQPFLRGAGRGAGLGWLFFVSGFFWSAYPWRELPSPFYGGGLGTLSARYPVLEQLHRLLDVRLDGQKLPCQMPCHVIA